MLESIHLPIPRDIYFWAKVSDWARGAKRRDRFAEILSERNKQIVKTFPETFWQNFAQHHFSFIRSFCFNIAQTVADSMNVDIDTDAGFVMP